MYFNLLWSNDEHKNVCLLSKLIKYVKLQVVSLNWNKKTKSEAKNGKIKFITS